MTINDDINKRKGRRVSVGVGVNSFIHNLDEGDEASKKAYRTAKVQNMFKECCEHIYGESAFLILQNTNAVYILNDRDKGMLKKARSQDKQIKRLIIYTCDSMVYADLDSRQENVKYWFDNHGEYIDKLELVSSKFNMRKRFPYKSDVELMKNNIINENNAKHNLLAPDNPEEIKQMISKIKDEKLRQSLENLIPSS